MENQNMKGKPYYIAKQLLIYGILKFEDNESLEMVNPKRLPILCGCSYIRKMLDYWYKMLRIFKKIVQKKSTTQRKEIRIYGILTE